MFRVAKTADSSKCFYEDVVKGVLFDMRDAGAASSAASAWGDFSIPREALSVFPAEELGNGAFGIVCKGTLVLPRGSSRSRSVVHSGEEGSWRAKQSVAVKQLPESASTAQKVGFRRELDFMRDLAAEGHHAHVVEAFGVVQGSQGPSLVLELCTGGNLLDLLRGSRPSSEDEDAGLSARQLCQFVWQVADGGDFLASKRILHRDLAARNILLAEGQRVKIADFGLSVRLAEGEEEVVWDVTIAPRLPLKWMAPESLREKTSSFGSEVWAFGVLCWEALSLGAAPYVGLRPAELLEQLEAGKRLHVHHLWPHGVQDLIRRCWDKDPSERPRFATAKEALAEAITSAMSDDYGYLDFGALRDVPDDAAHQLPPWTTGLDSHASNVEEDDETTL